MNKCKVFSTGVLVGIVGVLLSPYGDSDTRAELQAVVDGHDLCMRSAGTTRCRMTPADFVEYYRAKNELVRKYE